MVFVSGWLDGIEHRFGPAIGQDRRPRRADAQGAAMTATDDARSRAAATYNAAADRYDDPANSFWARFGRETIARLPLATGNSVLDVCCGTGASAIPAAERVGAAGFVLGLDLAERPLALARTKAGERGLRNVEFRVGDLLELDFAADRFDAVVCVFGIFFVPDMAAAVRALWRAVRPGGTLAITTWGPRFFEPGSGVFWDAIRRVRPDLHRGFNPWDRVCKPAPLRALLEEAGVADAHIVAQAGRHPIASPEAWWAAVEGSGYRGTLEQLSADEFAQVRDANLEAIARSGIAAVEANVVFATASR
jgi:ubiquinone/menaquinone biosynthesis C-methylase UbiE